MSATESSDRFDLNSDFASVDGENEPRRGYGVSGSTVCVGVVESEPMVGHLNGPMEGFEGVSGELGNDRLEGGVDCGDGVSNLELEMGHFDVLKAMEGCDVVCGKSDGVVENVAEVLEEEMAKMGCVNALRVMGGECRVEDVEGKGGVDVAGEKSDRMGENVGEVVERETISMANDGAGYEHEKGVSIEGDDGPVDKMCVSEIGVADTDVFVPSQDPNASKSLSVVVTSEITGNQHIKENMEARTEDNKKAGDDAPVLGASEITGNEFNLFVDFNSCMDREGNSKTRSGDGALAGRVSEITGNEFNASNLFVDLNSCMAKEGDSKYENEVDALEGGISEFSGNEFNASNLFVDLNSCMDREVNSKYGGGIVSSGNPDKTRGGKSRHYGKKNSKRASARPCVSDLVWGKVRCHPWWPGMIFDPSAATEMAKKHYKKDCFLIAYFGDQTFAWNEASQIKPFSMHFSKLEKQSNSEDFQHAVECALDEISRRVEFGLACSCLTEDLVASMRSQTTANAGIREESSRIDGGDTSLGVDSFEPAKLMRYIKRLAVFPHSGVDRLQHVISQAQVLSFRRSKGFSHMPEFKMHGRLLEEYEELILLGSAEQPDEMRIDITSDIEDDKNMASVKGNLKTTDGSNRKRKKISGVDMKPIKRERSLSGLMAGRYPYSPNGNSFAGKIVKVELIPSSSIKKRKAVDSTLDDSAVKLRKMGFCASGSTKSKQTLRVGESILRVASELNGRCHDESVLDDRNEVRFAQDSVVSACTLGNTGESPNAKFIPTEYCAPDEMISRLRLAAKDPMKGYSFTVTVASFFSDFKNSVCVDPLDFEKLHEDTKGSELQYMEGAYLNKKMVRNIPEEQMSIWNLNESEKYGEKRVPDADPQASLVSTSNVETGKLESANPVHENSKVQQSQSPTALILNFTDLDSIPSVTNLNMIYSKFGCLNESQTKVLKKSRRAKVVFSRRSDAEKAFSSAGKYKIFGPSLISYSLKYTSSTSKASPSAKKKLKNNAS